MKKENGFLTTIVISILIGLAVITAIFVILQIKTGLDPSPYLAFLAPIGAVELTLTALITSMKHFKKIKQQEQNND